MTEALLDANVLIAAFDRSHADHLRALGFVSGLDRFHTSPQTQGAFLRFLTRPWTDSMGHRHEPRMTTGRAVGALKQILALPQHRFLADDVAYDAVSMRSLSGFKQWNDAYLIAMATRHGLRLATLDGKMENMDSPEARVVHVVS